MVRNPSWSAETDDLRPAYADEITIEIGGSVPDLYNKLQAGELDYVMDPPEADQLKEYSTNPDLQDRLHVYPQPATSYTSMNLGVPPFDDVQVRKAVNLAYDKAGGRQLAGGPLVGVNAGHIFLDALLNNLLVDYDPYATPEDGGDAELAKEQMSTSKYDSDGDGICDADECTGVVAIYASDSATGRKVAALWQQNLEEIGIELDVKGLTTTAMYAKCNNLAEQVPICLQVGWLQDYPDPYTFGPPLFGSSEFGALYPGCCNYSAVGATEAEMEDWGYPVTSVPSADEAVRVRCTAGWRRAHSVLGRSRQDADGRDRALGAPHVHEPDRHRRSERRELLLRRVRVHGGARPPSGGTGVSGSESRARMEAGARAPASVVRSAADHRHAADGLHEVGVIDAVAGPLPPHRLAQQRLELVVARTRAHRAAQVRLLEGEQAVAELPLRGQPHAVARVAERLGDARDHPDSARGAVGEAVRRGRLGALAVGDEREHLADAVEHRACGRPSAAPMRAGRRAACTR